MIWKTSTVKQENRIAKIKKLFGAEDNILVGLKGHHGVTREPLPGRKWVWERPGLRTQELEAGWDYPKIEWAGSSENPIT